MERKIGEIFEYNGEWYQCIEQAGCHGCAFSNGIVCTFKGTIHCFIRSDDKLVSFKKLEKIGEPYSYNGIVVQKYKIENTSITISSDRFIYLNGSERTIEIEIKQNVDMEKKKLMTEKLKKYFAQASEEQLEKDLELLKRFNEAGVSVDEFIKSQEKLSLKPFDLEAAKSGKPVCTRDGRKARIICFDVKGNFPIAVAVAELEEDTEIIYTYPLNGRARLKGNQNHSLDLMMFPEKKEGWINVYNADNGYSTGGIYSSKEEAEKQKDIDCVATIKIEWEE